MSEQTVLTSTENRIGRITFNQPDNLNPLGIEDAITILETLSAFEKDNAVRVILFTGNGKHFSSTFVKMEEYFV